MDTREPHDVITPEELKAKPALERDPFVALTERQAGDLEAATPEERAAFASSFPMIDRAAWRRMGRLPIGERAAKLRAIMVNLGWKAPEGSL